MSTTVSRAPRRQCGQPHVYQGGPHYTPCTFNSSLFGLLLPLGQHYTFYDFIVNKARGKSGPLFNFDVHDDVRLLADATKEKDESHAGKVVERSWYNRNKHIFPASRWEVFDPEKSYGKYTIA